MLTYLDRLHDPTKIFNLIEKGLIKPFVPETPPDIQIQEVNVPTKTIESGAILPLKVKVKCVSGNCTGKDFKIIVNEMIDVNSFVKLTDTHFTMSGQEDSVVVYVKIPKVDHEKTMTLMVILSGDNNLNNNQKAIVINVKPSQKRNINGFETVDATAGIFVSLLSIILLRATKR